MKKKIKNKVRNETTKELARKDLNKNLDLILDIMKNGYNQHYERTQSLDSKSGFFVAFHAALIAFVLDFETINKMIHNDIESMPQIVITVAATIIFVLLLLVAIAAIVTFMCSLISRNIKYVPEAICAEVYYNSDNIDFKKRLLEGYKDIARNNEEVLKKKHRSFNLGVALTIAEIVLWCISIIFKLF